jgi:hypothetical protein
MFSKALIAALIVAATAVSLSTKASAGPVDEAPYMSRASHKHDNGGNCATGAILLAKSGGGWPTSPSRLPPREIDRPVNIR